MQIENSKDCILRNVLRLCPTNTPYAVSNEAIMLLKDRSLVSAIGLAELAFSTRTVAGTYSRYGEPYLVISLIYLVMTLGLAVIVDRMESRFKAAGGIHCPPKRKPIKGGAMPPFAYLGMPVRKSRCTTRNLLSAPSVTSNAQETSSACATILTSAPDNLIVNGIELTGCTVAFLPAKVDGPAGRIRSAGPPPTSG